MNRSDWGIYPGQNGINLKTSKKLTIEQYMKQHLYTFLLCSTSVALLFCGILIGETSKISPILHEINNNLGLLTQEQRRLAERQKADFSQQYIIHSRLYFKIDSLAIELKQHIENTQHR